MAQRHQRHVINNPVKDSMIDMFNEECFMFLKEAAFILMDFWKYANVANLSPVQSLYSD